MNQKEQMNIETKSQLAANDRTPDYPHDIFDLSFKRIVSLSHPTIVNFINGLFGTDYPLDSTVTYNWTENVDKDMKHTISDTIITINGTDSYHLEAQMYKDDNSIMLRVFDYGYSHSKRNSEDIFDENGRRCGVRLRFPRQIVIYLNPAGNIPDEYLVNIIFDDEKEIKYYIPTIKFQNESLDQIREKHMIILLPFKLLKVRDRFRKAYDEAVKESSDSDIIVANEKLKSVIDELRNIWESDIIQTIEGSFKRGEISRNDTIHLVDITTRLMNYLYSKYSNVKEVENMLYDQSLDLITDKLTDRIDELESVIAKKEKEIDEKYKILDEKNKELNEKNKELVEKDKELDEKDKALDEKDKALDEKNKELDEKDKALDESRALISALQKELEDLKKA
ncbi:MAG: hypothetical protein IJ619_00035 [Eubacterium sp.]|nr:hypothetical protein [Eubacterium sp.]